MTAQAFKESITVYMKSLGPQASAAMAQTGHQVENRIVSQQTARKGIRPGVEEAVDGRRGVPFEQVKPDGLIYIGFDYRAEAVAVCFDELRARSPVFTGRFRDSHFAMLDGKGLGPLEIPAASLLSNVSRITVTNPLPYARRIEVGVTESGAPFVADPHIFESVMIAVRREYGAVAKFSFGYVDLEGAYIIHTNAAARRPSERKSRGAGTHVRYPAIFIDRA